MAARIRSKQATSLQVRKFLFLTPLALFLICGASSASAPIQSGTERTSPASQSEGNQTIHLQALLDELLSSNPDLQAARKGFEAALTRPAQESALPDPRIIAGWVSNGWPYPGAGLGIEPTSSIGFQVAQELPFPGKRALKNGIAQKQADGEAQTVRALEVNLTAQLKSMFYDLRYTFESLNLIREKEALLQQLAKAAEIRYTTGTGAQQDVIRASTEISILENRRIVLDQRRLTLDAKINALLNRPADSELGRPEPAAALPALEAFVSLQTRALEASPLLGAQRAVIDGRQLNVQSAQKAYYPDFDVMGGYYNQGSLKPMWEFKVQVNVPLYFWKKQRYGLEEAGAMLAEAQLTYRAQEQTLSAGLRERYLAAQAARSLMDLYSKQIVPQSQLALESSLAAYETGRVDFLSVLSNFNTILDYQLNYHEQQAEYLKALAALEELIGSPLGADSGTHVTPGAANDLPIGQGSANRRNDHF